jgi:predicted DNA-binding transcriptional regulator AlpA
MKKEEPAEKPNRRFLTEREVEELGVASRRTLQTWRLLGHGPRYIKVRRSVRYRVTDIEQWLAARTITPAVEGGR